MLMLPIPHRMAKYRDPLSLILRTTPKTFQSLFALASQEARFCRAMLQTRTNWWVFRCNQKIFAGDFVLLDMSSARPEKRYVMVVELKSNRRLCARKGHQLQHSQQVLDILIEQNLMTENNSIHYYHGCGPEILELCAML